MAASPNEPRIPARTVAGSGVAAATGLAAAGAGALAAGAGALAAGAAPLLAGAAAGLAGGAAPPDPAAGAQPRSTVTSRTLAPTERQAALKPNCDMNSPGLLPAVDVR